MSVYAIYFSPTNGTEKIVKQITNEFGSYEEIDLSRRDTAFQYSFQKEDICVIGVPSYGGRVPAAALERMKDFRGNSAKTILVVSYGNREYEDTFRELADCVMAKGFCCVAAVAVVAEHSIMHQFASGRPDKEDEVQLRQFSKQIIEKMNKTDEYEPLKLPGNMPYREYNGVPLKPKAGRKCTGCGRCAELCPVGAIPAGQPDKTNSELCISCMRCIKVCPSRARKLNPIVLKMASRKMKKVCAGRKENELYL